MNLRFVALLLLVIVLASLTTSSPLEIAPTESTELAKDPENTSDGKCNPDISNCSKTRGFSGMIGVAHGFGEAAKAAIKSFVGIIKNIIGIKDKETPIDIHVSPEVVPVQEIVVK
ncbi:uncharacterized protein [Diabrotica undecimpunctata]|uniref:uncharacterized protein n=1 Tax=Diabrotica undecimpunctata TaxID=50387 RepID=UPI003B63D202